VSEYPQACVVDASVGVKLVLNEDLSEQADQLFTALEREASGYFAVPDLFFIECANVLWKNVRRLNYPRREARQDILHLAALRLEPFSTRSLAAEAFDLANEFDLTAYDACYVVLAKQLDCPLVTADEKLVRRFAKTGYQVLWLGDLE
jgi:predicted nucleic acid-binding protein